MMRSYEFLTSSIELKHSSQRIVSALSCQIILLKAGGGVLEDITLLRSRRLVGTSSTDGTSKLVFRRDNKEPNTKFYTKGICFLSPVYFPNGRPFPYLEACV